MIDDLIQAIFGLVLIGLYAAVLVAILFTALLVHATWRWLNRHTLNSAIIHAERKALR
jgi:hypothetical protein